MLNQLEMQGIGQDQCPVDFLLKFIVALNEAGLASPQIYPPRLWRNKESLFSWLIDMVEAGNLIGFRGISEIHFVGVWVQKVEESEKGRKKEKLDNVLSV